MFFRLCKRRILPIMSMVITPLPCCTKMQHGRLFTWLSFGSALPSKLAQFSVGANTRKYTHLGSLREIHQPQ
ncbi:hypothetical protein RA210_U700004 [Rubrivivax sp. A210]|nr:hypothetical protein RA210_U700004 [Rubrivivax sp. A210]